MQPWAARDSAARCRGYDLYRAATQTVFGEGKRNVELMLVGETPGDREDLAGRPFVASAGRLLDRALAAAGIAREATYVTNAVKHFKFEPRGKRRARFVLATVHPSAVLRILDVAKRDEAFNHLVADLEIARSALERTPE